MVEPVLNAAWRTAAHPSPFAVSPSLDRSSPDCSGARPARRERLQRNQQQTAISAKGRKVLFMNFQSKTMRLASSLSSITHPSTAGGSGGHFGDIYCMSDENILRMKANEAMRAGKLPQRRPKRMWGGPGIGAPCAVCAEPVKQDELGFEFEFAVDDEEAGAGDCHVHLRCFAAWEFERRHYESSASSAAIGDSAGRVVPPSGNGQQSAPNLSGMCDEILPDASNDGTIHASRESLGSACERDKNHQRGSVR